MVTGIECAGLVLGVFPLLIEGIKAYNRGIRSIKRAREYKSILRQYCIELTSEHAQFKNTWYRIVQLIRYDVLLPIAPNLDLAKLATHPENAVRGLNIDLRAILSLSMRSFSEDGVNEIERIITELATLIRELAAAFQVPIDTGSDFTVCTCFGEIHS